MRIIFLLSIIIINLFSCVTKIRVVNIEEKLKDENGKQILFFEKPTNINYEFIKEIKFTRVSIKQSNDYKYFLKFAKKENYNAIIEIKSNKIAKVFIFRQYDYLAKGVRYFEN